MDELLPCENDPELWFADAEYLQIEAKRGCHGCPVRDQCLEFGKFEHWGVWGGMSAKDRQRVFGIRSVA